MHPSHPVDRRRLTLIAVALVALVAALAAAGFSGRTPVADAATTCRYSADYGRSLGPSYVTSIKTTGAGCSTAKKVVRAFHSCRLRNGGKSGRCPSSTAVRGYRCTENRGKRVQGQFSSKVTCKRGSASVVSTYSQFS